jgi:hypothetical protein
VAWVLTGWATGRNKTTGVEQSVRVQMKYPDYNANEEYAMVPEASGVYRRFYHEWPEKTGHSAKEE